MMVFNLLKYTYYFFCISNSEIWARKNPSKVNILAERVYRTWNATVLIGFTWMQTYRPPFKSFFFKFIITSKRADRNSLFAFKRHKWHKKSSYLVFPAHHRKPHVAAACYPDQFTLRTSTAEDTHTPAPTAHTCFFLFFPSFLPSFFLFFLNPRERINLLTWTDKSKTSQQLHRLSVIHWAFKNHCLRTEMRDKKVPVCKAKTCRNLSALHSQRFDREKE